ncbi:MAG: site-2 protease family protein [Chloroflexota bacterium]
MSYMFDPTPPVQVQRAPVRRWRNKRGTLTTGAGILAILASKLKYLFVLLKFGKVGGTLITMLVSVGAYALLFGWPYAVGFVALLFCHEMGHVIVARWQGVNVSAPMFVPFLGAFIAMRGMPEDSLGEAAIAAGGPVVGSIAALGCLGLYGVTHQPLLLALAYVGFFLNLFNLIPMSPLDGGRILGAASRWAYVAGLPILAVIAIWHFNPFLLVILALGVLDAFQRFRGGAVNAMYYTSVSPAARWAVAGGYVLLAGLLAIAMSDTNHAMQVLRSGGLVG